MGYRFWWLRQSRCSSLDSVLVRWNTPAATSAISSDHLLSSPHPLLDLTTMQKEKFLSSQETTETLRQQQKLEDSSSNDDEGKSVDSPRTFYSSHSILRSLPSPVFSPLSPLMKSMRMYSILRRIWPLQRRHFWTIVAWDIWDIARYVILFYLLLILAALL